MVQIIQPMVTAKDAVEMLGAGLGLLLSFCVLVGLIGKWVVLPWLEDRFAPLALQVKETHHQVSTNGHVSADPTLKDRVDSLRNEVRELKGETRRDLGDVRADLHSVGQLYDAHVEWSGDDRARLWRAILELQRSQLHGHETPEAYPVTDGNPAANEGEHDE